VLRENAPMQSTSLTGLLIRWQEAFDQGKDLSADDLCPDQPQLAEQLRPLLEQLRKVGRPQPEEVVPPTVGPQTLVSAGDDSSLDEESPPTQLPSADDARTPALPPGPDEPTVVQVPGYALLGELGRGGMGVVYKARQVKLNRVVALKMILAGAHAGVVELARFRTEAEAIARLQHPNIVAVYEVGECQGRPFLALEFCGGGSLDRKLAGNPLPPEQAAKLVEALARAMHAAHEANVIHRDLKPANILLAGDASFSRGSENREGDSRLSEPRLNEELVPKVTDFGLAKKLDEAGQTHTGDVMGTPSYIAPEQAQGKKDVGPTVDVYALGAILYECLTGRPPFKAATVYDTLVQVMAEEAVPPRRLNSNVPTDLETICLKCLSKVPARRYRSAEELAEDLARWQREEPIQARPVGALERGWRWCRRNPWLAGLAAAVVLSLAAGAFVSACFAALAHSNAREATEKALLAEENAEKAAANARAAQVSAAFAGKQRDLTLDAFNTLLLSVHEAGGNTPALRGMKGRLVDTAEKGLARLNDPRDPHLSPDLGLAQARGRLGSSFMLLGRLAAARREYEAAVGVLQALLAAQPNHQQALVVLPETCVDLAKICAALADRAAARKYADQALRATAALPDRPADQVALESARAGAYYVLTDLAQEERNWTQARKTAREMLAIHRRLAARVKDTSSQRQLAQSHSVLGEVEIGAGDYPAAAASHHEAVRLLRDLIARVPNDPDVQYVLSRSLVASGQVSRKRGDRTPALASFREALAMQQKLETEFPHTVLTRGSVSETCHELGEVSLEAGDLGWARQYLARAAAGVQGLLMEEASNPTYLQALAKVQLRLGEVSLAWRGYVGARNHYRQALTAAQKRAKAEPGNPRPGALVFEAHARLARASRELGQHADAELHLRAARGLIARLGADLEPDLVRLRAEVQKQPAAPEKPVNLLTVNSIGMELVLLQPGKFQMGARATADATAAFFNRKFRSEYPDLFVAEHPRHQVTISRRFHLGTTEVTRGQFRAFVEATGYRTDAEKDARGFGDFNPSKRVRRGNQYADWRLAGDPWVTDDHPVTGVSWNDAVAFCEWLSRKEKVKYRLPTEAEWEYACRAGTTTRFWTGEDPATLLRGANVPDATFREGPEEYPYEMLEGRDGYAGLAPVGSYQANPWGLYDMHGNVWEWCADGYDAKFYEKKAGLDPRAPIKGPMRVVRGGCFM
jgi:formylglycine-generating enzyme required for sulfatase activity